MLVVYVPTSPNPTSGFTLIVHESTVRKSPMTIEEVSSFIISLGADFPKSKEVSDLLLRSGGIKAGETIPLLPD